MLQVMVCPLMVKDNIMPHVRQIAAAFARHGIAYKVDDTGVPIGVRAASDSASLHAFPGGGPHPTCMFPCGTMATRPLRTRLEWEVMVPFAPMRDPGRWRGDSTEILHPRAPGANSSIRSFHLTGPGAKQRPPNTPYGPVAESARPGLNTGDWKHAPVVCWRVGPAVLRNGIHAPNYQCPLTPF